MSHSSNNPDIITQTLTVPVPVDRAFTIFTEKINDWWPPEYTWSGQVLETITIESGKGGRCFERGPHGFECDWGRVLVWQPPERVVFTWQIAPDRVPQPDPQKASEVEVQFEKEDADHALVQFEHRNFDRHGEEGEAYREALASPQGWPFILEQYKSSELMV